MYFFAEGAPQSSICQGPKKRLIRQYKSQKLQDNDRLLLIGLIDFDFD
jgi:hypothetical protein